MALDEAYSLYKQSDTHRVVKSQFRSWFRLSKILLATNTYNILQFTEFILQHRL